MNNRKTYKHTNSDKKLVHQLDVFIQKSLDLYQFKDYPKEIIEAPNEVARLLTSYKSFIPDLVIFNKKFNKNDCFYHNIDTYNNPYPRMKFVLRPKNQYNSSTNQTDNPDNTYQSFTNYNEVKDDYYENYGPDEEDPQWLDCKVEDFNASKVNFLSLPKNSQLSKAKEDYVTKDNTMKIKDKDIEKENDENDKQQENPRSDVNLNVDLLAQLESFFENKEINEKPKLELKSKMAGNKENISENIKNNPINSGNTTINDSNWADKLNLFKQHYDSNISQPKQVINQTINHHELKFKNEEANRIEDVKQENGINCENHYTNSEKINNFEVENFNELLNKFKSIPVPSENKELAINNPHHQNLNNPNHSNEQLNSSIEDNLANLKNLINDKDYDDNNEYNNLNDLISEQMNQIVDQLERSMELPDKKVKDTELLGLSHPVLTDDKFDLENIPRSLSSVNFQKDETTSNIYNTPKTEDQINKQESADNLYRAKSENLLNNMNTLENEANSLNNNRNELPFSNPLQFLENPIYVVIKNLNQKGWVITLADTEKVINCFNSFELLAFYEGELKKGLSINSLCATDYDTDMCFTPQNLYEVIKDNLVMLKNKKKEQLQLLHNQAMINKMTMNSLNLIKNNSKGNLMNQTKQVPPQHTIPGNTSNKKSGSDNKGNNNKDGSNNANFNQNVGSLNNQNSNLNPNFLNPISMNQINPLNSLNPMNMMNQMNHYMMVANNMQMMKNQNIRSTINLNNANNTSNVNNNLNNVSSNVNNNNFNSPNVDTKSPCQQSGSNTNSNTSSKIPQNMMLNVQNMPNPYIIPNNMYNMNPNMTGGPNFNGMMNGFPYGMVNRQIPMSLNLNFNIVNNDIRMNNIMINSNVTSTTTPLESKTSDSNLNLDKKATTQSSSETLKPKEEPKKEVSKVKAFLNSIGQPNTSTTNASKTEATKKKNKK